MSTIPARLVHAPIVLGVLALSACSPGGSSQPTPSASPEPLPSESPAPPPAPRFDPAKTEAMKHQLLEQDTIIDLLYSEHGPVEWQIGTYMRGSGVGYAHTICIELRDAGLVDRNTSVRMVNLATPEARSGNFRGASIGHVRCHDGADLGV